MVQAMQKHLRAYMYVDSKGPDQPVHPHSLIRAFPVC